MKKILATETKLLLREWPSLAFTIALPVGLLLILGSIPGFSKPDPALGGQSINDTQMPAMMTILAVLTLSLTVLPGVLAAYREQGVLRRMSTTPVAPGRLLTAQLLINLAVSALTTVLLIVLGRVVLGVAIPQQLLGFVLVFLLGTASMLALGLVVAALAPTGKVAPMIGSALMFPLMFVAGMWVPRELMSGVLRTISDYSVIGPFGQAMRDTWAGNAPQMGHLLVVTVGLVLFGGLAVRFFRWE